MTAYLEAWKTSGRELFALDGDRASAGSDRSNDVVISDDATVSRLHAVFERFPAGWSVRDLGSRNGTFVGGRRVWSERSLRPGDEVTLGRTRLVYRVDAPVGHQPGTEAAEPPPVLTRREREVVLALCRPVLSGDLFTEPASLRAIAAELFVTEAAVKQHLGRLYDKFGLHQDHQRRRVELANQAIRRGAVTLADLRGGADRRDNPGPAGPGPPGPGAPRQRGPRS